MCKLEHAPFEKPMHEIYKKELCISPIPSLALHFTNINSIFGLSPNVNGNKYGRKMRFKNIFFLIIFLSFTNAKSNELNLNDKYIPLKDFLVLKFDLFFEENVKNIYNSVGFCFISIN